MIRIVFFKYFMGLPKVVDWQGNGRDHPVLILSSTFK